MASLIEPGRGENAAGLGADVKEKLPLRLSGQFLSEYKKRIKSQDLELSWLTQGRV